MTAVSQVQSHPASVEAYIRHGWSLVPIPPGTKGPRTAGWNQRTAALRPGALPHGWGIGLAHAYSGTMALDIDAWDRAVAELATHGIDLPALYAAPDAVVIDSGRQGHGKLLYTTPFGLALPSKRVTRDGVTVFELRCATSAGLTVQDVLPPSIHPDTRQPYRWGGNGHWTRLPTIPTALLDLWQSLLHVPDVTNTGGTGTIDWDEIISAIGAVSPDCSREEWITIGMACQHAGAQSGEMERAYATWDTWSAKSATKYPGPRGMATQWQSFRADKGSIVSLGSLFRIAQDHGWQRPMLDVSSLFSPTEMPTEPASLTVEMRQPPPSPDLSLVPEVLRVRAMEISEGVGCDPLVPFIAGLGAVCGALDARIRLELMPEFKVPPILWLMTIGDPGDKKTPGSRPMLTVLEKIEKDDSPRYAKELLVFEVAEARYAAAHKAVLDAAVSPDALLGNVPLPTLPAEPARPVPTRITVQDITSQKLVRHAADRPRGLLCALDEMASWVGKICDVRSGEDKSAWTVAYEANKYEMDRVGSGTILAENYAVSIFGNIQPRVLRDNVDGLSKDGLIQRFIPIPLRHDLTRRGRPVPAFMTTTERYEQMVRVCYGLPALTYRLSQSALETYEAYQDWYNGHIDDARLLCSSDAFVTALGKAEGLCGRMALVWHCIESPYTLEVSGDLMRRVVAFMKGYVIPAQRYVFDGEITQSSSFNTWLVDYVVQYSDEATLTMAQIKRSARRHFEKVQLSPWGESQVILIGMAPLEDARWVARMDDGTQEHRGVVQWAVNPMLVTAFKDYRKKVIAAKQRLWDSIHEKSWTRPKVKGSEVLES